MKIYSCNIRCFGAKDGDNDWIHRKDLCIDVIRAQEADIICFQEMRAPQFADVAPAFPEFAIYSLVDEPQGRHPQNAIFYRSDRYDLISAGGYWLSETPHVPGSKSWQSCCVRLANWVRLEARDTRAEFRVVNTHLDHRSQEARENQAAMIVEDAQAYADDYPQLLTGDMNCDAGNQAIEVFRSGGWQDTYGQVHGHEEPGYTHHGFEGDQHVSSVGRIDWIFGRGNLMASGAEVIRDARDGRYPSDHYFINAVVEIGCQKK